MQVGIDNERARSHRLVKIKNVMFSKTAASRFPPFHMVNLSDAGDGIGRMTVVSIGDRGDSCGVEQLARVAVLAIEGPVVVLNCSAEMPKAVPVSCCDCSTLEQDWQLCGDDLI